MQARSIPVPVLALIGGTRGMLGAGLGLLLAKKLSDSRRVGVGRSLFAIGVLSTIPLLMYVFRARSREDDHVDHDGFEGQTEIDDRSLYGTSRMVTASPEPMESNGHSEPRSGGLVDAPGKRHRLPPPSARGLKSDHTIAKAMTADAQRRRPRG